MSHLHKEFTDAQVKELFQRYEKHFEEMESSCSGVDSCFESASDYFSRSHAVPKFRKTVYTKKMIDSFLAHPQFYQRLKQDQQQMQLKYGSWRPGKAKATRGLLKADLNVDVMTRDLSVYEEVAV